MTDERSEADTGVAARIQPSPRTNDVLAEICRAIARCERPVEVVQESAVRLQRYFEAASVGIWFTDEEKLVLRGLCLPDHLDPGAAEALREAWEVVPADDRLPTVQAMRRRQVLRWDAADPGLPADVRETARRLGLRQLVALPVYVEGEPVGAGLIGVPDDRPLTAADESLLETALGVVGKVHQRGVLQEAERAVRDRALQAHHLAAVGELAAGVAHEVNNPLSTITHFTRLLLDGDHPPEVREQIEAIRSEADRAAGTIRRLMAFAREDRNPAAPVRVQDHLPAVLEVERHQLALSHVDVRVDAAESTPPVRVHGTRLRRVLHNLLANARQAIAEGDPEGEIRVEVARRGRWVEVVVDDTGPGLAPDVAAAMFRPFFTTRMPGDGAGLGLAVVYAMIREHGGEIEGHNWGRPRVQGGRRGEGGARFVLRLPADVAPYERPAPDEPRAPGAGAEPSRRLDVLVVEDEAPVAQAVAALLARDGHRATVAVSAEDAVDRLEAGEPYDVVLSDFRMPGMGGEGLHHWLGRRRPDLLERLVFMSGDLLTPRSATFLESSGRPVLAKPFTLEALRDALAGVAAVTGADGGA